MARSARKVGCMGWLLGIFLLVVLACAGIWFWAVNNQSVATLDALDRLFGGATVEQIAGPVAYGGAEAQKLYVFRAETPDVEAEAGLQPVLVFIHGGSWAFGDPADYTFVARTFAPEGFIVVNAGYRLGEEGRFPAMLQDSAAALRWVHDNIARYGGDPQRIYLMGHSAGAYNVAMLGLDPQWLAAEGLETGAVQGIIGLAGPYDFYPFDSDSSRAAFGSAPDPLATQPVRFARADAPPMLLATGSADETVKPRNSRALAAALTAEGMPTEAVVFGGMTHSGIIMALASPFDRDGTVKNRILRFIEQREKGTSTSSGGAGE